MFSRPIKTRLHPARAAFSMKLGMLVAQGVDLDDEVQRQPLLLAHLDQAVEDRLPIAVAREIVVGDEEAVDALRQVGAHQPLDVVGVAPARLAPLHVDDRAEAALERATAPGVEGAERLAVAPDDLDRQKRRDLLPAARADRSCSCRSAAARRRARRRSTSVEPSLGLAGEQRDPDVARLAMSGGSSGSIARQPET